MQNSIQAALQTGFTVPARDSLWGHIYLTPELDAVTKSAPFMRLHRIFQLGPVYCVYPGATHTRASHSFGVFHLARRLLQNLAEKGASDWLTPTGVRSFLAASLLHDVGHFPYTHSLKELPLEAHEALTGKIILSQPLKDLVAETGADPYLTAAIVDTDLAVDDNKETLFYRKLLSGALDPDKLDYLNRDARYAGVPYGAQDVDFIFSRLFPHLNRGVDIDSKGVSSVEAVLFSKYLMYRAVYWHRSVRSATAMIKKALGAGLENSVIAGNELYGLDDQELFALMSKRSGGFPLLSLGDKVRNGLFYETIAEFSYDEAEHQGLSDLSKRSLYEKELAEAFSKDAGVFVPPDAVIIDIPEPVSFETGLYIRDEQRAFSESSSVFKGGTVDIFKKSLRIMRIFIDRKYRDSIEWKRSFL
jgi:HD superfamily phosphohydrolase